MKVETRDPWAFARDDSTDVTFGNPPRQRVTIQYSPRLAVSVAWAIFWRALWAVIRRRRTFGFWLEDES